MSAGSASEARVGGAGTASGIDPAGKAKAGARGRPKDSGRPKIDLDDEIAEANKLAEVSRKMLTAAKQVQKNNRRQKQRLVRKAGKLSAEDLERIAVIKRCGLYAEKSEEKEEEEEGTDVRSEAAASPSSAAPPQQKKRKLVSAVEKISGAGKIFKDLNSAMDKTGDDGESHADASALHQKVIKSRTGLTIAREKRSAAPASAVPGDSQDEEAAGVEEE